MIAWQLRGSLDALNKSLIERARHNPLAIAKAMTFTAEAVRQAEREEIMKVFDRPTRFTLNSLYLRGATPARLEARVWFKDLRNREHYLAPQVHGGTRQLKRFEKYLRDNGYLPAGMYVVPGSRAQLDSHGNMKPGEIVRILSALRALPQTGYLANRSAASEARRRKSKRPRALVKYFVGKPTNRAALGVWERIGTTGLRPILIFVRQPHYRARLDFYGIARRVSNQVFPKKLQDELQRASMQKAA